jgi:hypothetical protein
LIHVELNMAGAATEDSFVKLLIVAAGFYLLGGVVFGITVAPKALRERRQ